MFKQIKEITTPTVPEGNPVAVTIKDGKVTKVRDRSKATMTLYPETIEAIKNL